MQHSLAVAALALAIAVGLSLVELQRIQLETLVIYITPALRDLIESFVAPRFLQETGVAVTLVYVSAGEQYNRLRMSGGDPEADLFVHGSPLFLEKGYDEGHFAPFETSRNATIPTAYKSRDLGGGHLWFAFAWSPLAEVYDPSLSAPPDLASISMPFGFPHPQLSNNGVYTVLFFESLSPQAGAQALAHTVVQPVNARANILGIADGAFDVTLGYEAVTLFYRNQGAQVSLGLPILGGQRVAEPVLFSVGLVAGAIHPRAMEFVEFLFRDEVQGNLSRFYFRSVLPGFPGPVHGIPLPPSGVVNITYDWTQWPTLESALPRYVVGG